MTHHIDLETLHLASGGHETPDEGMCVMEAVAYFAHEPHSDHPACVSPVLGAFLRRFNDDLDDEGRQQLKAYIPKVVGTNTGPADDEQRAWMAANWLIHVSLPTWLDAAGMVDQATEVRALPEIADHGDWAGARVLLRAVRDAAWERRRAVLQPLRDKVAAAVKARLAERPDAVAAAAADADAVAAAVAVADAVAAAVAVADAAAVDEREVLETAERYELAVKNRKPVLKALSARLAELSE